MSEGTCKCKESLGIDYYKYVKIERHMGFVDEDEYSFTPEFCPHCGSPRADGWIAVRERLPEESDGRVRTFSPEYKVGDAMRHRVMDGQFVRICTDVTHWRELDEPLPKGPSK